MAEKDFLTTIEERLQPLHPVKLEIQDDSAAHKGHAGALSGGGHYHVCIISDAFQAKNRLQRHRLVYNQLSDLMPHRIHALSIEALTPQELPEEQANIAR